jgi:superfamily II DNA or RNA helicase
LKASISFAEEQFFLEIDEKVKNSTRFQINYFGFVHLEENRNFFRGNLNTSQIVEFIDYLKKNNFNLEICKKTQEILNNQVNNQINFYNKKKLLTSIKNNYNTDDFIKFCSSLNLKRELLNHQKETCYHLYKSECAANLSVPGSGKTSVVLAYYEKLKIENKVEAIFVIGPLNCFNSWETEFKLTLGRDSKIKILEPDFNKRKFIYNNFLKSELYMSSFATIANDIEKLKKFFTHYKFLLVVDEAHNIKKIDGIWSNAALELSKFSKYKVILTGTPMPNAFKDYYNYLDFLYGNNEIILPNEKAQIEVHIDRKEYDEAAELLREKIFPFYTRVTKKNLNLSKPNFNEPILIKMNPIEFEIHQAIITKIKHYANNDYLKNIDLMKKICKARAIRLRQVCSYVKNLVTAIPDEIIAGDENLISDKNIKNLIATYDDNEKPAKLLKLKEIVKDLVNNNKKVLIWSTHRKTVDLIHSELISDGVIIKQITGDTDLTERENIKKEFNNPSSILQAIIATPQSCSESISLHKDCQNAIYYDINYNAAEFLQSLDRIHRVGGSETKPVYYNFLHYENSVDIKIYNKVFEKADRQMKVIENDNLIFSIPDEDENYEELYKDLLVI